MRPTGLRLIRCATRTEAAGVKRQQQAEMTGRTPRALLPLLQAAQRALPMQLDRPGIQCRKAGSRQQGSGLLRTALCTAMPLERRTAWMKKPCKLHSSSV